MPTQDVTLVYLSQVEVPHKPTLTVQFPHILKQRRCHRTLIAWHRRGGTHAHSRCTLWFREIAASLRISRRAAAQFQFVGVLS